MFKTPTPPMTPPATEQITPSIFTCAQIEALNKQVIYYLKNCSCSNNNNSFKKVFNKVSFFETLFLVR